MGVPVLPSVSSGPHSAALRLRVPLEGAEVSQPAEAWPCLFLVCSHFLPPLAEKPSLVAQTDGKVTTCNVGDMGLIPGLGTSTGEGGTVFFLENSVDRGVWWATVHGVAKSQTRWSDFHFHLGASLVTQVVKNLPAVWETRV